MGKKVMLKVFPSHGTAEIIRIPSAIPKDKSTKELFWAKKLAGSHSDFIGKGMVFSANHDDSHGKADVIGILEEKPIGIQVTELSYELARFREPATKRYLEQLIEETEKRGYQPPQKTLVSIQFPDSKSRKISIPRPSEIIDLVIEHMPNEVGKLRKKVEHKFGSILYNTSIEGEFYGPSLNKIGFDANLNQILWSMDLYIEEVKNLFAKKESGKADWLLIWSTEIYFFSQEEQTVLVEKMKETFNKSNYERVYFAESVQMAPHFDSNLKTHRIK